MSYIPHGRYVIFAPGSLELDCDECGLPAYRFGSRAIDGADVVAALASHEAKHHRAETCRTCAGTGVEIHDELLPDKSFWVTSDCPDCTPETS